MKIKSVDTVHFGIDITDYEINAKNLLNRLCYLKKIGQETRSAQKIELNKTILTVELSGARFYSYRLTCKDFTLLFADKPNFDNPPVQVLFSSNYLWSYGYQEAYNRFVEWFQAAFLLKIDGTRISRLDVCVDTDEAEFKAKDISGVVTYSKSKTLHYDSPVDDVNYTGRQFTGMTIGRGKSILCRIYNKTVEITKSGKEWFKEIWEKNKWDDTKPVWRVEFQLRRKVLKEFGINSVDESFEKIEGLWKYLTNLWLEIRKPVKGEKVTNWSVTKKWKVVQSAINYDVPALIRSRIKQGNLEKIKAQAGGLLISIGAAEQIENMDETLESLKDYLHEKLKKKGKKFSIEVNKRKGQYMGGLSYANS
ncbi:MAG TPA: replication initiation factor [Syntrophomonas sp.]|jgi:hypothetical protein|nr:replication initiation factor [Syntrophomonas sp.]